MQTETTVADSSGKEPATNKTPKQRSSSYPSYTVQSCVELTGRIDKEFTDVSYTPYQDISDNLGSSGGAFLQHLSSCVQYGLLELKKGQGYKPSPIFKKIKRPLPDENVSDFLKECFLNPELYKKLTLEFNDKQLPTRSGLANILDRKFDIIGPAADKAARIFLINVQDLQLINSDNILKLDTVPVSVEFIPDEPNGAEEEVKNYTEQPNSSHFVLLNPVSTNHENSKSTQQGKSVSTREIPIFLKGGREATLVLPIDFSEEDMARVAKVVAGYLP